MVRLVLIQSGILTDIIQCKRSLHISANFSLRLGSFFCSPNQTPSSALQMMRTRTDLYRSVCFFDSQGVSQRARAADLRAEGLNWFYCEILAIHAQQTLDMFCNMRHSRPHSRPCCYLQVNFENSVQTLGRSKIRQENLVLALCNS